MNKVLFKLDPSNQQCMCEIVSIRLFLRANYIFDAEFTCSKYIFRQNFKPYKVILIISEKCHEISNNPYHRT